MFKNFFENRKSFPYAYILLFISSFLWILLVFAGPFLHKLPSEFGFLVDYYYYLFHFTCHQIPSRCYWLVGEQLPVCVRCFGIYAGFIAGLILFPLFKSVYSREIPRKIWLIPCFLPIALDGLAQVLHLYPSPHWLRLITGLLCGAIAICYLLPGLNEVFSSCNGEFEKV